MNKAQMSGGFTIPGESGCEALTLRLADAWGADTIRDSDGTTLSKELLESGRDIYSTLCLIRSVNAWAGHHRTMLQQNYLMSFPVEAVGRNVSIALLDGFSKDQFVVNTDDDPKKWWQVFDRSSGAEIPASEWELTAVKAGGEAGPGRPESMAVTIETAIPRHSYTVNFLAYRVWEEISMYNHVTNNWGDRERLLPVDPVHPEARAALLKYLETWLAEHPDTAIVRFTSLFYNFCWFWGDDPALRFVYSDWGSYDMTVSPRMMCLFREKMGYSPRSEDFVNAGRYNSTHNPPSAFYVDWMEFTGEFVAGLARECVDIVHRHGKRAYVFYDDHWIGMEPYSPRFAGIGFDGIIKCVFNAFEVRLCAGVPAGGTKEIRLHPYLFPTGLKGEPTFAPGGNPAADAQKYWVVARRALLRAKVDRIGLGGYLHLVEPFPDFIQRIALIAGEFRRLKSFHSEDAPWTAPINVGVLTAWGSTRSWICSGHLHEHPELDLIHVLEALAGMPFKVRFLDFDEIRSQGVPAGIDVLINAGASGSAWSGGAEWDDPAIYGAIAEWAAEGGGLIGIGEPSAGGGGIRNFRLSPILGVDREDGSTIARAKRRYAIPAEEHFITADFDQGDPVFRRDVEGIYITDSATRVLADRGNSPRIAIHAYGKGRAVYLSGFDSSRSCHRLLYRAVFWAAGRQDSYPTWACSRIETECAYFDKLRTLVVINNSDVAVRTQVRGTGGNEWVFDLEPYGIEIREVSDSIVR